jgi:hypothetical protein
MQFYQVIKEHVILGNFAVIKSTKLDVTLDQPMYAVNWFNTRFKWMYDFYNLLAAPSVFKIGGSIFFKGVVTKTLYGIETDSREVLLIVNYPSGKNFLNLVKGKLFILVSLLREAAVKQFSFGFTERIDRFALPPSRSKKRKFDRSKSYAIHHFKTEKPITAFFTIISVYAESKGIKIDYAGQTSSLLFSENREGKDKQVPCLMDGLILFEGDTEELVEEFLMSTGFQNEIAQLKSSYIALLKRTI